MAAKKVRVRKGFTLVELSLSIAFIAILSITIALIISNAISTYRRGLTLKQINTTGIDLVDDIQKAVRGSYGGVSSEEGIIVRRRACVYDEGTVEGRPACDENEMTVVSGAFCTGKYSYIWNSGYFFAGKTIIDGSGGNKMATVNGKSNFSLAKIEDDKREVCESAIGGLVNANFDRRGLELDILLPGNDENGNGNGNGLALYDLDVVEPVSNGKSAFYSISFILGTVEGGISIDASGGSCKAPNESDSNFDYCAINKFNFAAQANGG